MAKQTKADIAVTFTRETVAETTIGIPESFDPVADTLEDVVRDWLDGHADELVFGHDGTNIEIWNIEPPVTTEGEEPIAVPASVALQRWVNGYAVTVDEIEFDARPALDTIPLKCLPEFSDGFAEGACDCGDDVFRAAVRIHAVEDWDGPFCLYIADEDAYADYYDRRAAEAGLPPVER